MNKKGTKPMVLGLLLIVAAFLLTCYNVYDNNRAMRESQEILDSLKVEMPDEVFDSAERNLRDNYDISSDVPDMPVIRKKGYDYIGTLEIPKYKLDLPVMAEWDYQRLKISPCVYYGSYYTNNLVICAHNYRSHFDSLLKITPETDIYLTTVDGYVYHYVTVNVETLFPTEVERVTLDEESDLTLFTCYHGGRTRCVVRCMLVE